MPRENATMKAISRSIALLVLIALFLGACGGAAPSTPPAEATAAPAQASEPTAAPAQASEPTAAPAQPAEPAAQERTKITYWFAPPEQGTSCFVETAITKFNEQSKTVEVEAVSTPNAWDAARTAIAGGAGPDVVETPGPSF